MSVAAFVLVADDEAMERAPRRLASTSWLGQERRQRDVTQATLARRLGVSPQALSYYETERIKVPDDIARSLAELWDLDELYVRRRLGLWTPTEGVPVARPSDFASAADVPDNVVVLPLPPGHRLTDEQRATLESLARQLSRQDGGATP